MLTSSIFKTHARGQKHAAEGELRDKDLRSSIGRFRFEKGNVLDHESPWFPIGSAARHRYMTEMTILR